MRPMSCCGRDDGEEARRHVRGDVGFGEPGSRQRSRRRGTRRAGHPAASTPGRSSKRVAVAEGDPCLRSRVEWGIAPRPAATAIPAGGCRRGGVSDGETRTVGIDTCDDSSEFLSQVAYQRILRSRSRGPGGRLGRARGRVAGLGTEVRRRVFVGGKRRSVKGRSRRRGGVRHAAADGSPRAGVRPCRVC